MRAGVGDVSLDYRIVARIKNNRLWAAVLTLWPDVKSQADAARRCGCNKTCFGKLLNMTVWPYSRQKNKWWSSAQQIADAVRSTPDYLFDGDLYGLRARQIEFEVSRPALESVGLLALSESPDILVEQTERNQAIASALSILTIREAMILNRRFGLDNGIEEDRVSIGVSLNISAKRVSQIEELALRKLMYRNRTLKEYI